MNPVPQSLKAALPELSSQLTNLKYDVNGHQKTSMDFLCSNFCQINDNIVTVKMMLLVLQLLVICKKIDYFSNFERSYNSLEPLADKSINPSDQLVNTNSSETSNLDNMTN